MRTSKSFIRRPAAVLAFACLVATVLISIPSNARAAPSSSEQSVAIADVGQTAVTASAQSSSVLFADWLRDLMGSRQRMIQISLIFVVLALFVIWWR